MILVDEVGRERVLTLSMREMIDFREYQHARCVCVVCGAA